MRVNWREEEIKLLLTFYKRMKSGDMHKTHPLVLEASEAIRSLEINQEYSLKSTKFRNPNGVALKLANFLFLDPEYSGKGMKGCSVMDRKIFNEVYGYEESVNKNDTYAIEKDIVKITNNFHKQSKSSSTIDNIRNNLNMYDNLKYPYKFESWMSSNDGGVRKPMNQESGRPLGNEILESKIHTLIRVMIKDYVKAPRKTLCTLVGGPGNGKTDLMEFAAECFFEEIGYDKLKGQEILKKGFNKNNRKAKFHYEKYDLLLTQDASQRDSNSESYLDALAQDFSDLNELKSPLVLVCINRGILESLKNAASLSDQSVHVHKDSINLIYSLNSIDAIIQNKTVWGNDDIDDLAIYTWSMDYDSLFEGDSINLIQKIVDKSNCLQDYTETNQALHALNYSFNFLKKEVNNKNLSKLLRCFEVLNGKRFTYREIFSLLAYLFSISDREEKHIQSVLTQHQKLNIDNSVALFQLLFQLYQYTPNYKLFNNFLFANEKLTSQCIRAYKGDDIERVNSFFNTLKFDKKLDFSSIPNFISSGDISYFDPIYFEQNSFEIKDNNNNNFKLKTIIDKVIYNETLDIDNFSNIFSNIDIEIIKCVEKIKKEFCLEKDYDKLNSQQLNSLDMFKGYLNSLLIAFIKRGILFSTFFIREQKSIEDFMTLTNPEFSDDFKKDFQNSISNNSEIENSLSTTVGQTSDQVKHNVYSKSEMYRLRPVETRDKNLPSNDQIFFRYRDQDEKWNYIVITYKIYKNIILNSKEIFSACLDKNYHLWNDLKKIELTDKQSRSHNSGVFIQNMGEITYNRHEQKYELNEKSR